MWMLQKDKNGQVKVTWKKWKNVAEEKEDAKEEDNNKVKQRKEYKI